MSDPFLNLATLWSHVWDRLDRGVAQSDDPFRFVTLATVGPLGAQARTVGLRAADRDAMTVEVHSDLRTAKVRAVEHDPRGEILLWDQATQLQVRLAVHLTLIPADQARWARIPPEARLNYGTDPAPGTPVDRPEVVTRTPQRDRFVALSGQVERMDVVSLAHDPHRRAKFDGPSGRWVAP
ncbi:pyridoxamine 5'-phosphate oxidase family protein [Jannaschia donghaensis]|uniref:PPOX class probable FMN-dependent enzyme, family n=1 Tax=Jannaschia donghaensis TaxID=420998 RepID=A0A0M6YJ59_9RHOB|nr:pyridoxamine 5'-phosphate oxidase family protein [Jannaschia donghaensis]CTQ49695.1 PPOX class probable FMN-dependent enzyme, family [Jannaschia donghaensis]